jgi:hypothetical protein
MFSFILSEALSWKHRTRAAASSNPQTLTYPFDSVFWNLIERGLTKDPETICAFEFRSDFSTSLHIISFGLFRKGLPATWSLFGDFRGFSKEYILQRHYLTAISLYIKVLYRRDHFQVVLLLSVSYLGYNIHAISLRLHKKTRKDSATTPEGGLTNQELLLMIYHWRRTIILFWHCS